MSGERDVAIFRLSYPNPSEAFLDEQMRCLDRYRPIVVCRQSRGSIDRVHVALDCLPFGALRSKTFLVRPLGCLWPSSLPGHPRLIHAHFGPDAVYAMPLASRYRLPLMATFHGYDITRSRESLLASGVLPLVRYVRHEPRLRESLRIALGVSRFIAGRLVQRGYRDSIVRHCYIGVDVERFRPIAVRGEERFVLCVARHVDVKGVDDVIAAFARIADRHPDVTLKLVGHGPLTERLRALAEEGGVGHRVSFLGLVEHQRVLDLTQRAELVVLASRRTADGAEEAFGLTLLEAAACGRPTIGTRSGGISEAVREGVTGFLCNPQSPRQIAEAMDALLDDESLRESMGKAGRDMACSEFDIRKQTVKLERLYDEASA